MAFHFQTNKYLLGIDVYLIYVFDIFGNLFYTMGKEAERWQK